MWLAKTNHLAEQASVRGIQLQYAGQNDAHNKRLLPRWWESFLFVQCLERKHKRKPAWCVDVRRDSGGMFETVTHNRQPLWGNLMTGIFSLNENCCLKKTVTDALAVVGGILLHKYPHSYKDRLDQGAVNKRSTQISHGLITVIAVLTATLWAIKLSWADRQCN